MSKLFKTTWIHSLRKDQLVRYAEEFNINADGTVEELRKRFHSFVTETSHEEDTLQRLAYLERKHSSAVSLKLEDESGRTTLGDNPSQGRDE